MIDVMKLKPGDEFAGSLSRAKEADDIDDGWVLELAGGICADHHVLISKPNACLYPGQIVFLSVNRVVDCEDGDGIQDIHCTLVGDDQLEEEPE